MARRLLLAAFLLAVPAACGPTEDAAPPAATRPAELPRAPASAPADPGPAGNLVYVPAYSHIFHRDARRTIDLAVTLSVRNTDPERALTLTGVRYYDDGGALVREFLPAPVRLGPMASVAYVVERTDDTGGVGANFLVEWTADGPVAEPLTEAVMVSTASALGVSFTSRGVPIVRR